MEEGINPIGLPHHIPNVASEIGTNNLEAPIAATLRAHVGTTTDLWAER